jgi:hypothetical protein
MGCEVNGPGEARDSDVGIADGVGVGLLMRGRQIARSRKRNRGRLMKEVIRWPKNRKKQAAEAETDMRVVAESIRVRALAYLAARARRKSDNVRVAQAERAPAKYLEQLLSRLRRGGLVPLEPRGAGRRVGVGSRGDLDPPGGALLRSSCRWSVSRTRTATRKIMAHPCGAHPRRAGALDSFRSPISERLRARERARLGRHAGRRVGDSGAGARRSVYPSEKRRAARFVGRSALPRC